MIRIRRPPSAATMASPCIHGHDASNRRPKDGRCIACDKVYAAGPEVKAKRQARAATPEARAKKIAKAATPEAKAIKKAKAAIYRGPRHVFDWQGARLGSKYSGYKISAEKRGYSWDISKPEFLMFSLGDCYYCGVEPKLANGTKGIIKSRQIIRGYSGLDRIDNSKGYYESNVVSCCWGCNSSKSDGTIDEYIERCIRVAAIHDTQEHFLINAREG